MTQPSRHADPWQDAPQVPGEQTGLCGYRNLAQGLAPASTHWQQAMAVAYSMNHPSCTPIPGEFPPGKDTSQSHLWGCWSPEYSTGKGVPKINSGLACLPGLCPGLKVECTWGALSSAATPPSGQQRSRSPRTQCRRGMWNVLPSRAPSSTSHCPPGGPSPLVEPRDQTELLGLDHDPGFPALCGQPRQGPHRPSGHANATPPLFTRPQVPVRHLDLEGTGRKNGPEDPPNSPHRAGPTGQPHQLRPAPCPFPRRGQAWLPKTPWRGHPAVSQAQAAGAILKLTQGRKGSSWRVGRGVRHPLCPGQRRSRGQWGTHAGHGWDHPCPASWPPQELTHPNPTSTRDNKGPLVSLLILEVARGRGAVAGEGEGSQGQGPGGQAGPGSSKEPPRPTGGQGLAGPKPS